MTKHFPKPPFKAQEQPIPGRSDKMDPQPDYGEATYRGSNRLKDKKTVITGADSGIGRAVAEQLIGHVFRNVRDGVLPPAAGTLIRLFHSETVTLDMDTALAISGAASVVGEMGEGLETGLRYLSRQNVAIGGGTTEMARNVIGERVLGFPREYSADRGVPFNQVRHGQTR